MTATVEVVTQDGPGGVLKPQGDYKGRPAAERQARKLRDTKSFHAVGVRIRGMAHVSWVQPPQVRESWAKRHL